MDDFDQIMSGVELEEPEDVIDFSELDRNELLDLYHSLTKRLLDLGQTIDPKTNEGRETHSQRAAAVVELHKRNIL
jgi:hypothetical protein